MEELSRLGVDANHEYVAGSAEADSLRAAWTHRQEELQEVMSKQLKAADYMADIAKRLVNSSVSDDDVIVHLTDLEQLVADIDNARDFHTVGGWPLLTSLLPGLTQRSELVQAKVVHCIGTAIKNDYDFQLWVLETAGGQEEGRESSVLDLLVTALDNVSQRAVTAHEQERGQGDSDELQRRLLYAISAALRGNLDVQAALSALAGSEGATPSFMSVLKSCVLSPQQSVGVRRKCWHIVSDLLDEMVYIRHDVVGEYAARQQLGGEGEQGDVEAAQAESVLDILRSLRPMGMLFVPMEEGWLLLAEHVAAEIASSCSLHGEQQQVTKGQLPDACVLRTSPPVRDIFTHAVKIRSVLRSEYGDDLKKASLGGEQWEQLQKVQAEFGSQVDEFLNHPLMKDELY